MRCAHEQQRASLDVIRRCGGSRKRSCEPLSSSGQVGADKTRTATTTTTTTTTRTCETTRCQQQIRAPIRVPTRANKIRLNSRVPLLSRAGHLYLFDGSGQIQRQIPALALEGWCHFWRPLNKCSVKPAPLSSPAIGEPLPASYRRMAINSGRPRLELLNFAHELQSGGSMEPVLVVGASSFGRPASAFGSLFPR